MSSSRESALDNHLKRFEEDVAKAQEDATERAIKRARRGAPNGIQEDAAPRAILL